MDHGRLAWNVTNDAAVPADCWFDYRAPRAIG